MADQRIYMFNALWFKTDDGAKIYDEYLEAVVNLIKELDIGAELLHGYVPEEVILGDWDPDLFFVVEYPSQAAFEKLVSSPQFQPIKALREQAIDKSLLLRCSPMR